MNSSRPSGPLITCIINDLWPYIKVLDDKNENCLRLELNLNPDSKKIDLELFINLLKGRHIVHLNFLTNLSMIF